jgi:hypothetical protein
MDDRKFLGISINPVYVQFEGLQQVFDWSIIRRDVMALWNWLHSLTPRELERSHRILHNPSEMLELLSHHPGLMLSSIHLPTPTCQSRSGGVWLVLFATVELMVYGYRYMDTCLTANST